MVLIINKKEETLKRKMERKLKEYMKKGIFDINTLKQEIYAHEPFKYQSKIFRGVKKDDPFGIETQYHNEMNQHIIWGNIL